MGLGTRDKRYLEEGVEDGQGRRGWSVVSVSPSSGEVKRRHRGHGGPPGPLSSCRGLLSH